MMNVFTWNVLSLNSMTIACFVWNHVYKYGDFAEL